MAVKQYIGARYVPLLDGDYDVNKTYEPLTTVNYGNATYTSKKKVPAGVVPTDSNYWMQTGFGNQQVTSLIDWKNNTVTPFIDDTNNELQALNEWKDDTVAPVIQDVGALNEWKDDTVAPFINDTNNELQALNDKIDSLRPDKNTVVLFGDSWFSNVTSIPSYIQNHYNCTLKNYSVAGTGFDVSGGYKEQLNTMATDPTIDLDDVKFAIISAGLNDHARGATAEQFATMFNQWKTLYNEKFNGRAIPPVYWFADYSLENDKISALGPNPTDFYSQYIYYRTVLRSIKGIRGCLGFSLVPGTADAWQTENWRHPNSAGGVVYAENICKIVDGTPSIDYVYQEIVGTVRGSSETMTFRFFFEHGEVKCEIVVKESVLGGIGSSGMVVDLPQNLPVNIEPYQSIGCGVLTGNYRYDQKTISFIQSTNAVNVLYAGSAGVNRGIVVGTRLI